MAKEIPSVGDLRRKPDVTGDEVRAATDVFLTDEGAKPFVFKSGHRVDVVKALDMPPQAKQLLTDKDTTPRLRRTMVMTAVIMSFPAQG